MNYLFLITGIIIGLIFGFITGMIFLMRFIKEGNMENEGFYWFNPYERRMINWKEEFISLVRLIGSATFGKERWFLQENGLWYDRLDSKEITIDELHNRIYEGILEGEENNDR